ncbi:MAG: hypothetical protein IJ193_02280 [Bacilli bacterium]|nr:hypothetical protein [Bacilli bacterium]
MNGEIGIDELDFGYSRMGTQKYMDDLNTQAITETCRLLRDINGIKTAIQAGWQGQSEENFVKNFEKAIGETEESIKGLREILDGEFASIEDAVANQDNEMVPLD